ncbi:MAG: hypothetical protein IPI88_15115 [Chitinophagaceae bacterium]|nr:hypothetical protein [Chitinophagaceae bacterium]
MMPDHITHKIVSNIKECHLLHFFCKSFINASVLLFLSAAAGCKTENQALTAYKSFTFDTTVMNRLPLYDSLAFAILRKIQLISLHIDDENAYHAFRYMPASAEAEVFKKLPPDLGAEIDSYYKKLGDKYIYAFDVFKDSTIKIYVRSRRLETKVDVQENLSYYPAGKSIRQREYPAKDTILNTHWQYWARFDNPGFF